MVLKPARPVHAARSPRFVQPRPLCAGSCAVECEHSWQAISVGRKVHPKLTRHTSGSIRAQSSAQRD